MATSTTINGITFYRYVANADYYGNERIVTHFHSFLTDDEIDVLETLEAWAIASNRAKKLGWSNYRGKNFGGGMVTQYCTTLETLANEINNLKNECAKNLGKYMNYKG